MRAHAPNPSSECDPQQVRVTAAFAAVAEHFSHIAIRDIIDPPAKGYYDAYLARQMAWHIVVLRFGIAKKRLVKIQPRSLDTLQRSLRIVDERCGCPVFKKQYDKIAARADALLRAKLKDAA